MTVPLGQTNNFLLGKLLAHSICNYFDWRGCCYYGALTRVLVVDVVLSAHGRTCGFIELIKSLIFTKLSSKMSNLASCIKHFPHKMQKYQCYSQWVHKKETFAKVCLIIKDKVMRWGREVTTHKGKCSLPTVHWSMWACVLPTLLQTRQENLTSYVVNSKFHFRNHPSFFKGEAKILPVPSRPTAGLPRCPAQGFPGTGTMPEIHLYFIQPLSWKLPNCTVMI